MTIQLHPYADARTKTATVKTVKGDAYKCTIDLLAQDKLFAECDCGETEVKECLCVHLALFADTSGQDMGRLVHPHDTADAWRDYFEVAGDFLVPSTRGLTRTRLGFPVITAPSRGRPKKSRIMSH